jgi:hypothetical protein
MLSFVLLFVVAGVNWRLPGFILVLVGLWMNFLVITVNEGMPVMRDAVVASGQADTLEDLQLQDNPKHHLATEDDKLTLLSDLVGIGPPIRQVVSVGDLAAVAGITWFVVAAMQRRGGLVLSNRRRRGRSEADRSSQRVAEATET